jgi:hypothetical protein
MHLRLQEFSGAARDLRITLLTPEPNFQARQPGPNGPGRARAVASRRCAASPEHVILGIPPRRLCHCQKRGPRALHRRDLPLSASSGLLPRQLHAMGRQDHNTAGPVTAPPFKPFLTFLQLLGLSCGLQDRKPVPCSRLVFVVRPTSAKLAAHLLGSARHHEKYLPHRSFRRF